MTGHRLRVSRQAASVEMPHLRVTLLAHGWVVKSKPRQDIPYSAPVVGMRFMQWEAIEGTREYSQGEGIPGKLFLSSWAFVSLHTVESRLMHANCGLLQAGLPCLSNAHHQEPLSTNPNIV